MSILLLQTVGCGTLLYPERRGQTSGSIDPGVAILDGVGLLVFIIPGLIAFGVDFATGAIYVPGSKTASTVPDAEGDSVAKSASITREHLETAVGNVTGTPVDLTDPRWQVVPVESEGRLRDVLESHSL